MTAEPPQSPITEAVRSQAGDGSPLGSLAWLLVPRLTFMVAMTYLASGH
jgi:hypothetical protein